MELVFEVGKIPEYYHRHIIMNAILSQDELFTVEEIDKELQKKSINRGALIERCVEDLLDNGQIYEIGRKYKVKDRKVRLSRMMCI